MNTAAQIIQERLAHITRLDEGGHSDLSDGVCAMEAAAYIAGEPWSDHPKCVCPVISAFMRSWNDALPDDKRTSLLLPLIPATIGTRGSAELANRRATMGTDWLVRVHTPAWLRLAGLTAHADALTALPEITDFARTPSLRPVLEAARKDATAAWDAAWTAARDAAGAAARDAAWTAAGDAARDAAGAAAGDAAWTAACDAAWTAAWTAAWDAARAAAWTAARDAAGDAAWTAAWAAAGDAATRDAAWTAAGDAAWDALSATVTELQTSAVDLVKRMCALSSIASTEASAS